MIGKRSPECLASVPRQRDRAFGGTCEKHICGYCGPVVRQRPMNSNEMSSLRQHRVAEQELIEALSSVTRKDGPGQKLGDCPTAADLRRFASGQFNQAQRDQMLAHLGACDRCITVLRQMRERGILIRRASLVLAIAVAVVLAVAVWARLDRSSSVSNAVATVDLRLASPTRGIENNNGAAAVTTRRKAGRLRIILPIGSEGKYECQILRTGQSVPLLRSSGEALSENHDVVLNLSVELGKLMPGRYSLALRREGSEWVYYPLIVQ